MLITDTIRLIFIAGKSMNKIITHMKDVWIDSDYSLTEEELLALLPTIIEKYGIKLN